MNLRSMKMTVSRRNNKLIKSFSSTSSSFTLLLDSFPLHLGIVFDQILAKMSYNVIVIIHHYTKWLPDDETRPYDDIAPSGAAISFHRLAQHRQWYLE